MPYDFYDDVQTAITFEFDLTFYEMERTAYNILDWFGDLGGLLEALLVFFGAIYGFVHYETFNNFLVQKLYRTDESAQLQYDSTKEES